jgi:hypothetical protein
MKPTTYRSICVTAATALLLLGGSLTAAPPEPDGDSKFGEVTERHVMIPMRDGQRLSAYIYLPPGTGPWPVLYEQRYADVRGRGTRESLARLASHGYAVVVESFRGAQLSEGTWVGYRALGWGKLQDGYDSVEWLARQPWSTGKIGTFGGSQAGYAQNFLAVTRPPHLVCQYMIDTGLSLFHEGYRIGGTTRPQRFLKMAAVCRNPADSQRLLEEWFAHPRYDDYWADEDCTRHFDQMNVPCFTIGSWFDFMCVGSVQSFVGRQHHGGPQSRGRQQLLLGPWLHGSFKQTSKAGELTFPANASFDQDAHMVRWFDHYLKGSANGVEHDPTVRYYVMGAVGEDGASGNVWREAADWPIPATATAYYLQPHGKLSTREPGEADGATEFVSDPLHPAEIPGIAFPGARDARPFEAQPQVRTFTTEALKQPLECTGLVRAELAVSSTAPDTDFIVRVSDVYPDGRSILLVDSIRRARYREGFDREVFLTPGAVARVALDIGWTSQIFNRGHRIRVTVASTGAPFYEPSPNTDEPLTLAPPARTQVATNHVHHSRSHASRIFLPLVAGRSPKATAEPKRITALFLGDHGHHQPAERAAGLIPAMKDVGIDITYTDQLSRLTPENLRRYDCLILYANHAAMSPEQEAALVGFVDAGGGFVPIHCASACFGKSAKYVALVGGRFKSHGTGEFRPVIVKPDHPIMQGFRAFETWDETYVHSDLASDRVVLMERVDGKHREPWTWIRRQGKGRVFYTASGHDERAWHNPGFLNLIERGIRWSVGGDPTVAGTTEDPLAFDVPPMTPPRKDVKPFEYVPAKVAFYPPGGQRKGDGAWNQMQLPLEPQESIKHLRVPQGFAVELFAAEPQIGKPICMNWDERGRLWIAETVDYPNELQPEGQGRDRIRICEDTDGDGRADKFTVFADKLSIPTSLAFARGGVIVHQAPHTLYLQDTDGDNVADQRRILFTGWSTGDTHAGPSNLVYGLDNWMYGVVGYAGFSGTIGGEKLSFKQGFYRFRPDGSKLEFLRNTNNNTWGIGFSEEGLLLGSTANHNPSVYMPIPNRYYEAVRGWSSTQLGTIADTHLFHASTDKIRQVDHHGGYTAAAGHALYTARVYPEAYWNRTAFVAEPTGHLVGTFVLAREGADFKSTNPGNLLESDDEWTAPIMAEVGPDGNVWVIDWYNYIVQHNPTPVGFKTGKGSAYETDLRDKRHGRIYRIVYPSGPASDPFDLRGASAEKLVAAIAHPNLFWRRHAQRLLVERGKYDVLPALIALAGNRSMDEAGLNVGAMHALWTLHGLGTLDGQHPTATAAATAALTHPSAGVRRNAVAVVPRTEPSIKPVLASGMLDDADAQARMAAFLALSEMPSNPDAARAIAARVNKPANLNDRWLPDAMTSAAATHAVHFLHSLVTQSNTTLAPKARPLVAIVAEHYARGGPADTVGSLFAALASADRPTIEAIVAGLAAGWPKNVHAVLGADARAAVGMILAQLPPGAKGQLVNVVAAMGSNALDGYARGIATALEATIADAKQSDAERTAAARQLMQFRASDAAAAAKLVDQITPRTSPELAIGFIDALAASESTSTGSAVLAKFAELTPAARAAAIRLLLSRTAWTESLLAKLEAGQVLLADLSLDQKQALAAHPNKQLAARARQILKRGGVLPNADRQKVLDELLPLTRQTGDVAAGKAVFVKQCAKCHTHSGQGNKVGPDLTGMAVHPKAELLTHIIDPSRSVEGNFRAYTVVTDDGLVMNGLLASETKTAIEIFDAEGKKHTVQRDVIEQLVASNKSIMPEGFEKQLPAKDLVDLLEFLTAKGKFLPLPLNKVANVVTTKSMFHEAPGGPDRLIFDDWSPKTFAGVPFQLIDPRGQSLPNAVLLYGPSGTLPPKMAKSVRVPCNAKARAIHLLSGVSGWGYPIGRKGDVSMIVRLHYEDGQAEDIPLRNGEQFADYIRRVDVPGSQFAFALRGQQLRYLAVYPQRDAIIRDIEFLKGPDHSAPIIMAATIETKGSELFIEK